MESLSYKQGVQKMSKSNEKRGEMVEILRSLEQLRVDIAALHSLVDGSEYYRQGQRNTRAVLDSMRGSSFTPPVDEEPPSEGRR